MELYERAKKCFNDMVAKATPKEIEKASFGFGISAAVFAKRFVNREENEELYTKIYNIYFNYFRELENEESSVIGRD